MYIINNNSKLNNIFLSKLYTIYFYGKVPQYSFDVSIISKSGAKQISFLSQKGCRIQV